MKLYMRRWAALALAVVASLTLLVGCGQKGIGAKEPLNLSVCLGDTPETLDPIRATSVEEQTVLEHLYENLMRVTLDSSGNVTVVNGMAKDYERKLNSDGTVTYTFQLRDAKWSDGQAVTAENFVYAWRRLADPASQSPCASLLWAVAGYSEVQQTEDASLLQVAAPDEATFVVTLNGDCDWFLSDTCTAAATMPLREDVVGRLKKEAIAANQTAQERGEKATATWSSDPAKLVTNGPYLVKSDSQELVMAANAQYDGVKTGPDTLTFHFAATSKDAWALYESEGVDFVWPLPEEQMEKLAGDANWSAATTLSTGVLLFNTSVDPFSDPLARRAFSQSIDRTAFTQSVSAAAWPAVGLIPYGVPQTPEEDFRAVGGELVDCDPENYGDNCTQAKTLLSQAGYDTGDDFPVIECLYPEESISQRAADALTQMWAEALGVQVTMTGLEKDDLQQQLKGGNYMMAIQSVDSLINDAEGFLLPWTSESQGNVVGYYNSAYDTLLTIINGATDSTARMGCLHDAESLLLEDGPLTPLYFSGTAWKLRENYLGLCRDARGWFSFVTVAAGTGG